jgi:4-hydroxybenzoate polyprenyltransferase
MSKAAKNVTAGCTPLCVDLDGTLIKSDLLIETVFALIKSNPFFLFILPVWLSRGKAYLKHQVARRIKFDPSLLPYHVEFLDFLKKQHANGRRLVLATASNELLAEQVSVHLGIFGDVIASDSQYNVSGSNKRKRLQKKFGDHEFDYAGNDMKDVDVWRYAGKAIVVNADPGVVKAARRANEIVEVFDDRSHGWKPYVQAMRLYQWFKNVLVFIPIVTAQQLSLENFGLASIAFICFGLCASSVYILNDLFDLPADRAHPRKCKRPFAAGTIHPVKGVVFMLVLLLTSFCISLSLPWQFTVSLCLYYLVTNAYSLSLKQKMLVDVVVLAGLYTMRVIAGAAATLIVPSFWLLAFSMFLFFSLAIVKRSAELGQSVDNNRQIAGRAYIKEDLFYLNALGIAAGVVSVLVIALYINSPEVVVLYGKPEALWMICPMLLYWISRMWLKVARNEMHDDPLVFTAKDRVSMMIAALTALVLLIAI